MVCLRTLILILFCNRVSPYCMEQIQYTLNSENQSLFLIIFCCLTLITFYVNDSFDWLFLYCNKGFIVIFYASVSQYFLFDCKRFLFQRVFFICVSMLPDVNDIHITLSLSILPSITLSLKTWSKVIQGLIR